MKLYHYFQSQTPLQSCLQELLVYPYLDRVIWDFKTQTSPLKHHSRTAARVFSEAKLLLLLIESCSFDESIDGEAKPSEWGVEWKNKAYNPTYELSL